MRSRFFLSLFLVASGAAFAQGPVVLYTSLAPTESGPLGAAFEKKTGIKVEIWRAISEKVVQRAVAEARAGRPTVDVVETNGPEMEMMARENLFRAIDSSHLADIPKASIPKHRLWVPDRLNFFVVAYNTSKVRKDELPKDYRGFADPKWRGRIGIEATDAEWMATLVKLWGDEGSQYFRKLSAMKPDMRKGHVLLAQLVASGEIPGGAQRLPEQCRVAEAQGSADRLDPDAAGRGAHSGHRHREERAASEGGGGVRRFRSLTRGAGAARFDGQDAGEHQGADLHRPLRLHRGRSVTVLDEQDKWEKIWQGLFLK
jgi:hypothetical protein